MFEMEHRTHIVRIKRSDESVAKEILVLEKQVCGLGANAKRKLCPRFLPQAGKEVVLLHRERAALSRVAKAGELARGRLATDETQAAQECERAVLDGGNKRSGRHAAQDGVAGPRSGGCGRRQT